MKDLRTALQHQQSAGLYRRRRILEGPQGTEITLDGRKVVNFCSNNYLGLANHPNVKTAFINGIKTYGAGGGAAHLINGHSHAHHELEQELAEFTGYPRCMLYSTGYMANLGIAQALLERGDMVIEDRLNHASLLDAGLLSGARLQRYRHADVDHANRYLEQQAGREKLLMTDGVFSMDGDLAPLPALATSCRQHNAWLMVDDAHGIGVLGELGRGSVEYHGLNSADVPILMGTLGKAFGTAGAFVAGSEDLIEYLIQRSRTYIYTTASPPAVAEATRASLKLVQTEPWRRQRLQQLVSQFRESATQIGLQLMDSCTPIQPVLIGDSQQASLISEQLLDRGFHVSAIRPPTVPEGTARLRITLCAEHSDKQLEQLMAALNEVMNQSAKL